jgi:predicted dinucleotide-binding enzyme
MAALAGDHRVRLGSRDPAGETATATRAALGDRIAIEPLDQALRAADAVIVAIPGTRVVELAEANASALSGKLVIDATNDLRGGHGGALHHLPDWQRLVPGAELARAFCSVGWENIAQPGYGGETATMFWCGPEPPTGDAVEAIIRSAGLEPVRIGGLEAADTLDGVARLWFQLAFAQGLGRRLAFRLLRDPAGS